MISASMCLAMAIYFESAVEPSYNAGLAVAEVILNRVKHPKFEDTICGVVTEDWGPGKYDCQFSFYCDGKPERPYQGERWERAKKQARDALTGKGLKHSALFYHTTYVKPKWSSQMVSIGRIGKHIFYREK